MSEGPGKGSGMDLTEETGNSENLTEGFDTGSPRQRLRWHRSCCPQLRVGFRGATRPMPFPQIVPYSSAALIMIHGNTGSRTEVSPLSP